MAVQAPEKRVHPFTLPGARDYFPRLLAAAKRACSQEGETRHFALGGYCLAVTGAGKPWPMLRALDHLATAPGPADLTIHLVNADSEPPAFPQHDDRPFQEGDSWHLEADGMDVLAYRARGVAAALEQTRGEAVFWARDIAALPQYEFGSPLLRLFHWWFCRRDRQLLHAAALGLPEGGVLLTGKGGAGKSTSALACVNSALRYAADDYCVVSTAGPPTVFSLYNSAKVHWENCARFPHLGRHAARQDDEKALYFLHESQTGRPIAQFPIRAILVPRVTGLPHTRIRPISRAEAFLAAAPSTVLQLPGAEQRTYENIGSLFRSTPCFALEAGTDLQQIPGAILALLSEQ